MEEQLKSKTVKGTFWSGIDNVIQLGVSFIISIILARLLSPDDYGLIGIISIFTVICTALINGGFSVALIRKKEVSEDDYNTSFLVNLIISVVLYTVLFLCSPIIAKFFHRVELIGLIRVSSISMVIGALSIVQQTRLTRRIDFKTQTKITLISNVISGILGIIFALLGFGVWALVIQQLTTYTIRTLLLFVFNKWIPKLRFSKSSFSDLFGFGWKMMASNLLDNIWKELYQLVVGKFYNPATLGQYTRSNQFSQLFSSNLTNVIQRVTFPVLASIQDDRERLVSAYRRIIKISMFVSAICMLSLGAIAEPLIYTLIGTKWKEAALYLPLICIPGSLYPLHALNLNMLQVQGRSDLFLGLEIIKKIIAIGPLLVGTFVGIIPMLYASIVINVACFFLNSYYTGKFLGYSSWMQIKDVIPSYLLAIILSFSVYYFKYLPIPYYYILLIQLVVGICLFFYICIFFEVQEYIEIKNIVLPYINKYRK